MTEQECYFVVRATTQYDYVRKDEALRLACADAGRGFKSYVVKVVSVFTPNTTVTRKDI